MADLAGSGSNSLGTVLITGGCGFIGTNLVKYLAGKADRIRILDNLSVGKEENLRQLQSQDSRLLAVDLVIGDIRNPSEVNQAVKGADAVIHLAAHTSVVDSLEKPAEDWEINVSGTFNVLEACRQNGVARFILASSNAVIGEQPPPIDESKIPRPLSPYGAAKLTGEAFCSCYYHSFGLKTVSLRFANCYGPYSDHKTSVITKFFKLVKEGKSLTIYGDGNQTRDFVHSSDIARALYLALMADMAVYGDVFQVATGVETRLNELVGIIKEMASGNLQVIYEAERKGEIKRNYSDIAKARRVLGFEPTVELRDGLRELWELYIGKI